MTFSYHGWIVDATPDFSFGLFFAHARLTRSSSDDDVDTEMHIERNLAWFDSEEEAIQCGRQSAIAWINERDDDISGGQATQPFVQRSDSRIDT
ncbi:hypothetical protein [Paraburkholderia aspalathi]|uniref:Uncharacterized protein n=1 Tax=Paraburkholderia aspalathi TaxID=1324617 RepID=A0A1I7EJA5_9BURK|nr:hypothetical protein [Paraburkholderia aspalathi]SFU23984.1 hypothetical protein SAMN05192563_102454 [Paraburkholderia aspalathi]